MPVYVYAAVLLLPAAYVLGVWLNGYVRPFAKSEVQGVKLEALLGPIMSMAVLLLAFTLVTTFGSYQRAVVAASDEARKADYLFELGRYMPDGPGTRIEAATACYAAAVATFEWETMAQGRTAPEVSVWTAQLRDGFDELVETDAVSSVVGAALTADRDRGEARSRRLTEARPAVPDPIKVVLVGAAATGVLALATFTLPLVRRRVQIGALGALTVLLVVVIVSIDDVDRPYQGLVSIDPVDMARVAGDLREDFIELHPDTPPPCDDQGLPTSAD